jgi:hypothetical protein
MITHASVGKLVDDHVAEELLWRKEERGIDHDDTAATAAAPLSRGIA